MLRALVLKNKELLIKITYYIIAIFLVFGIILFIYNFKPFNEEAAITVGAVFIGDPHDQGWNQCHYEGIVNACREQSCALCTEFKVPEEETAVRNAVSALVAKGCSCIFLTSYGYGQHISNIAKDYPQIAFYDLSDDGSSKNCMSYFARMYQVRYLSGIVAGAATKSGILGYVTSMPVPETIRSVNAYTMGIRKVNPSAKVLVKYTGSWDDKALEENAVKELSDAGADVITFHEDRPYSIDLADEMGLYTTGYNFVYKDYSDRFLTAAVTNWDMLYEIILNDYLSGRANFSQDYWLGLSDDAVSLYPYSDLVTPQTKDLVESEAKRIMTWRDVFSGEILDDHNILRCEENECISDDELFNKMDWYVEGVKVYE